MNEKIGILGAIPEEVGILKDYMDEIEEVNLGGRAFYTGKLFGKDIVLVFSRWGKVAAASTTAALILHFGVTEIVFCGVAGGIHPDVKRGDIVVGNSLIQHDLDPRPIMPRWEIPLTGIQKIPVKPEAINRCIVTVEHLLNAQHYSQFMQQNELEQFGITTPKLHCGLIASGDQFIYKKEQNEALVNDIPDVLCVEMEGAAVAQVCMDYGITFSIFRTISDRADEDAHIDFPEFIRHISGKYTLELLKTWFNLHHS